VGYNKEGVPLIKLKKINKFNSQSKLEGQNVINASLMSQDQVNPLGYYRKSPTKEFSRQEIAG